MWNARFLNIPGNPKDFFVSLKVNFGCLMKNGNYNDSAY